MAASSFMKDFKLKPEDSKAFIIAMNEPSQPLLADNFKSHFSNVKDDRVLFEKALNN